MKDTNGNDASDWRARLLWRRRELERQLRAAKRSVGVCVLNGEEPTHSQINAIAMLTRRLQVLAIAEAEAEAIEEGMW